MGNDYRTLEAFLFNEMKVLLLVNLPVGDNCETISIVCFVSGTGLMYVH